MEKPKLKTIGIDQETWRQLKLLAIGEQKTLSEVISFLLEEMEAQHGKQKSNKARDRTTGKSKKPEN